MSSNRRWSRGAARAAALTAVLGLAACADVLPSAYDLPESPDVEAAPWPRLIDSPAPAPLTDVKQEVAHGEAVRSEMDAEAAALAAEAEAMSQRAVVADRGLSAEAAELRRLGKEVDAAQ